MVRIHSLRPYFSTGKLNPPLATSRPSVDSPGDCVLAEAGAVTVSGTVFDQVASRLDFGFDFVGEHEVKNIAEVLSAAKEPVPHGSRQTRLISAAAAVIVVAVCGVVA